MAAFCMRCSVVTMRADVTEFQPLIVAPENAAEQDMKSPQIRPENKYDMMLCAVDSVLWKRGEALTMRGGLASDHDRAGILPLVLIDPPPLTQLVRPLHAVGYVPTLYKPVFEPVRPAHNPVGGERTAADRNQDREHNRDHKTHGPSVLARAGSVKAPR